MTPDRQHIRPPMTPHHWLRIPQPNDSGECSTATASLRFPMLGCGSCCTATAPKHPSRRVASVVLWHPNAWFVCCCFWYIVQTKHNIYINTYIHTCMHACMHACIHIHTYIHTYVRTYIHTYIHTSIHTYINTYIYFMILYYIISYHIILYHIRSYHIRLYYIILCIYIYIPGNPKASFFSIIRGWHIVSVTKGLLVRLKARSEEPKYVLLTRVKSKKTCGFLWGFIHIVRHFSGELSGQSNWHVSSIKCYLCSVKMKQAHTVCWRFFAVITGKSMRSWKFDYENMSLLVIRHMTEKHWRLGSQVYIYIYIQTIHSCAFLFFLFFVFIVFIVSLWRLQFFSNPQKAEKLSKDMDQNSTASTKPSLVKPASKKTPPWTISQPSLQKRSQIPDLSQNNHRRTSHQVISLHI